MACRCDPNVVASCQCSSDSTDTIEEVGAGTSASPFTYNVKKSAMDGNAVSLEADGIYVPGRRLVNITVLTNSSGTYNTPADITALVVECIGGGGGGGGVETAVTNESALGGGGGGGAWAQTLIDGPAASYAYAVGQGGAGGAAGSNAGAAGSATSFGSPSVCEAGGGQGGSAGNSDDQPFAGEGSHGGTPAVGDVKMYGGQGHPYIRIGPFVGFSGSGGAAARGGPTTSGRRAVGSESNAGIDGRPYGGGGSGAASCSNGGVGGSQPGGDGADGVIIVYEYGA